ncbi:hypothetical protein MPTK1_6g19960 [Marchantia polymorpha subsp. ruderalis]|uniref:Uncharacterized protein n=2 Tax=Marchantia polymorpha TaxID=3197 RepID=A0AAF6BTZ9_MARPO|nr:hypothetical protein MARPO_0045s0067 [Marchantia polymorpha]BBN15483.1 hypothetical protein Mp_6g19960 [Marchantia polymorpha subsp. ruderalis]|eukprot:PTQ39405.1 hypothetical protein MARPO_0045s0067 [Marchantia polymorpha]
MLHFDDTVFLAILWTAAVAMDRVATLKRSASRKARDEREEGKRIISPLKKAKELHPAQKPWADQGSTNTIDDIADGPRIEDGFDLSLLTISGKSPVRSVPLNSAASEIEEKLARDTEMSASRDMGSDDACSSDPLCGTEIWNAEKSAERFARLRQEILRRYHSHEIFRGEAGQEGPHPRSSSWPKLRMNPDYEPRKLDFEEEKKSHQTRKGAAVKSVDVQPTFVFTAGSEWRNARTRLGSEGESGRSRYTDGANEKGEAESCPRNLRQDTPYKVRKSSRSRIVGKSPSKFFQRRTTEFLRTPTRLGSNSLEKLLTAESPGRTPEKSNDCVQILRNIRASQKAHEEARKLARQHSAAERARLTAELQMIARDCSISNCSSPARESWVSVKSFLSNLFCCGCSISNRKAGRESRLGEDSEEVPISDRAERLQDTARFEPPYWLQNNINLLALPKFDVRQTSEYEHKRSVSCDFEAEKAMTKRDLEKKHSD